VTPPDPQLLCSRSTTVRHRQPWWVTVERSATVAKLGTHMTQATRHGPVLTTSSLTPTLSLPLQHTALHLLVGGAHLVEQKVRHVLAPRLACHIERRVPGVIGGVDLGLGKEQLPHDGHVAVT
jgi:hypothetical protein